MHTDFARYDVIVRHYDPRSKTDQNSIRKTLEGGPELTYVELTSTGVTFQDDYRRRKPQNRIAIQPVLPGEDGQPGEENEFNTDDVMMILLLSKLFVYDQGRLREMIEHSLDAGVVLHYLVDEDGFSTVHRIGESFAALRGDFAGVH